MNKDRKSTVKKSVFAIVILAVLISLIGGTYARYISTASANGSVEIAKWAVKVNETDITSATSTFDLTFTAENANTVPGKVAPGGKAVANVEIDLTGTEVSVDFDCALDAAGKEILKTAFGDNYADKVTVAVGTPTLSDGAANMTIDAANKAVTVGSSAMSGKVIVPITLTWTNADANDAADTATGVVGSTVQIPVSLSVKQKI